MFRKNYLIFVITVALFVAAATGAFAQTVPTTGNVELDNNGTKTPVAGALIEVFRTDMNGKGPSSKTDKNGVFHFAYFQLGSVYTLSVSAPGCAPTAVPNISPGQEHLVITLHPGDGSALTEDQARQVNNTASLGGQQVNVDKGEMTAEQKKEQAEYDEKVKENNAKKEQAQKNYELVSKDVTEGNAAMKTNDYDLAIAKYTEGIDADPNFAGSAPILLNNRGTALKARGIAEYNASTKLTDAAARSEATAKAKKDLGDAAESFNRALDILKTAGPPDVTAANLASDRMTSLAGIVEVVRLSAKTKQVDDRVPTIAKERIPEYVQTETDATKKVQAKLYLAETYLALGDATNAIAAYREIIDGSPDNLDAMAGLGLSLVNAGYINSDKAMFQEGANYLQKFVSLAPDTHEYKTDAVALLDSLKKEQNVVPQKVTSTKKKN